MQNKDKNKVKAHKYYEESVRFMNNSLKELKQAKKRDKVYQDIKHLQVACGIAYIAMLKAIEGIFVLQNIPKPKKHASIEYYQQGLASIDRKMLDALNIGYRILHIEAYYEGFSGVKAIQSGFEEVNFLIGKLKQAI